MFHQLGLPAKLTRLRMCDPEVPDGQRLRVRNLPWRQLQKSSWVVFAVSAALNRNRLGSGDAIMASGSRRRCTAWIWLRWRWAILLFGGSSAQPNGEQAEGLVDLELA